MSGPRKANGLQREEPGTLAFAKHVLVLRKVYNQPEERDSDRGAGDNDRVSLYSSKCSFSAVVLTWAVH